MDDDGMYIAIAQLDERFRSIIGEVYQEEINRAIYTACKKTLAKAKAKHAKEIQKIYAELDEIPHYTHTMDSKGKLATVVVLDDVRKLFLDKLKEDIK